MENPIQTLTHQYKHYYVKVKPLPLTQHPSLPKKMGSPKQTLECPDKYSRMTSPFWQFWAIVSRWDFMFLAFDSWLADTRVRWFGDSFKFTRVKMFFLRKWHTPRRTCSINATSLIHCRYFLLDLKSDDTNKAFFIPQTMWSLWLQTWNKEEIWLQWEKPHEGKNRKEIQFE